ncbi:MAG TPA: L,D-transpeptidase family protein [Longimicrobiales bacterium]|nr:L,D-transpeptidase family protein [Longimicrobiales bacterium]
MKAAQPLNRLFLVAALAAGLLAPVACSDGEGPLPQTHIRSVVRGIQRPVVRSIIGDTVHLSDDVGVFYRNRGYQPVWTEGESVLDEADEALGVLRGAVHDGLDPESYRYGAALRLRHHFDEVEHEVDDATEQRMLGDLDLMLTEGFRRYSRDLAMGTLDPEASGVEWEIERNADPGTQPIEAVANGAPPLDVVNALRPITPYYTRLMRALQRYREAHAAGGWPLAGEVGKIEPGDSGAGVTRVRARLAASADSVESALARAGEARPDFYDERLVEAVKRFQYRHGLEPDGVVGGTTVESMNVPIEHRIVAIRTNLDRWRWLPRDLGNTFIMVNVAGQELEVVENDTAIMSMNVVVGKVGYETPIFRDTLEHIVVNPYWNVPRSIADEEIWPAVARDPGYLARNNMEVVNRGGARSVRQRPGPQNALGEVKFLFPNRHNVYLHDTPADHLFSQRERAFSHGCVRVERPRDLARLLFEKVVDTDPDRFDELLARDSEQWINVKHEIPVYILYFTAWARPDGVVNFYSDIYERDEGLREQVDARLITGMERRLARWMRAAEKHRAGE